MKKTFVFILLFMCFYFLPGCTEVPAEKLSNKNGVYTAFGIESYIIKLPSGKSVQDYFTFSDSPKQIVAELLYDTSDGNNLGAVEYCKVSRGGYVAYTNNLMVYIPSDDEKNVQMIACALVENQQYMSIEEAKQYIPWL